MKYFRTLLLLLVTGAMSGCASSTMPREVTVQVERVPPDRECMARCEDLPLLQTGKVDEVKRLMLDWAGLYRTCQARQECLARFNQ